MTSENKKTLKFPDLARAFKKARLGVVLCGSLLLGNISSEDTSIKTTPVQKTIYFNTPETSATAKINDSIRKNARKIDMTLLDIVKNDYSHTLDSLETVFNTTLNRHIEGKDNAYAYKKLFIMDPNVFDLMAALGTNPQTAVINSIMKKDVISLDLSAVKAVTDQIARSYITRMRDTLTSPAPRLLPNGGLLEETGIGFIIPSPLYHMPNDIEGFTRQQSAIFFNTHESFHARDNVFTPEHLDFTNADLETLTKIDVTHLPTLPQSATGLKLMAHLMRGEAYPDVGAAGEVIRAGGFPLSFIDGVIAWRDSAGGIRGDTYSPITHLTQPALRGLQIEINKMGLETFKSMNEKEAEDFYIKVTKIYGADENTLRQSLTAYYKGAPLHYTLSDKEQAFFDVLKLPPFDRHFITDKGQTFYIQHEMDIYQKNLLRALCDAAFDIDQKIIPESLTKAYAQMQNDLIRHHGQEGLEGVLFDAKMEVLKKTFINAMQTLNFSDLNQQYGVDADDIMPQPLPENRKSYQIKLVFFT